MSKSDSTTGNYRVMTDLDFDGVDMSPIEDFSGVFDGGGHKLSNINLVNGKGTDGGFFGTISRKATIKNINFYGMESSGTWDVSGGLIGCLEGAGVGTSYGYSTFHVKIESIQFDKSCNNGLSNEFGLFAGVYVNKFCTYNSSRLSEVFYNSNCYNNVCMLSAYNRNFS